VAVSLEGTHTEFVRQGEGLLVVTFGLVDVWGIAMHGDVAKKAQGIGLHAPLAAFLRENVRITSSWKPIRTTGIQPGCRDCDGSSLTIQSITKML